MIVHIVMIKFKEQSNKDEIINKFAKEIQDLLGKVPSLKDMEVGINFSTEERAMDLVLRATFDDREGLEAYAVDPEHIKVINGLKEVAEYSKVVDYETLQG